MVNMNLKKKKKKKKKFLMVYTQIFFCGPKFFSVLKLGAGKISNFLGAFFIGGT